MTITLFVPGGVLLGGYLVRRFDLKRSLRMAARFCVIASVFTVAGSSAWFIPGCGVPDLAGVIAPYNGRWDKNLIRPQSSSNNFIQRNGARMERRVRWVWRKLTLSRASCMKKNCVPPGEILYKILYVGGGGGSSARGPTPYPFVYHFDRKGTLSHLPAALHWKKEPLSLLT